MRSFRPPEPRVMLSSRIGDIGFGDVIKDYMDGCFGRD